MKKRILSSVMLVLLLVSLVSMAGCGLPSMLQALGAEESFEFSVCYSTSGASSMRTTLDYVYADTTLHLYDDGTWTINRGGLFKGGVFEQGTYTVLKGGIYVFEGLEYGMDVSGEVTESGFRIHLKDFSGVYGDSFVLCFEG